ncbi:Transposase IS4 [Fragilaria crotonensis]|nr:Transposase IS4 [Fragilaria crotonensis]
MNSRNVKAGHVAAGPHEGNGLVTESGIQNSTTTTTTNDGGTSPWGDTSIMNEVLRTLEESSSDDHDVEASQTISRSRRTSDDVQQQCCQRLAGIGNVAACVHGIEWRRTFQFELPLNGSLTTRQWSVRTVIGDILVPGRDNLTTNEMSPLEFFLLMFPPKQLNNMMQWTNIQLVEQELQRTNTSELLKFFGIIILSTKFEFTSRSSLWSTVAPSKYRPAPQFGLTGMSKHRFEELFRAIRFSNQPPVQGDGVSSEAYRWMLIDDFVANFNDHRANYFNPSDRICVDESMSRWYGQGGHWINLGLPQYVAIDRKPENGCEIQNSACGRSGVMLRLKLVKGVDLVGDNDDDAPNEDGLLHGTKVLKEVVSPWFETNRIVCADSYFASVGAAKELFRNGLKFIGVVKTATKGFPKAFLSSVELQCRGDFVALVSEPANSDDPTMASLVNKERNADPEKVTLTIQQPEVAEIYYSTCAAIDKHNRYRQDDLRVEKKIETHNWAMRVNLSIFAMVVVDTWLVFNAFKNQRDVLLNQKEFYSVLAEELIDNCFDQSSGARKRSSPSRQAFQAEACARVVESESPRAGVLVHLTPVKRLKNSKGEKTSFRYQGRCKECQKKTTWQCSDCEDAGKTVYLCSTKNGQRCFAGHLRRNHTHLDDF